MIGYAYKYKIVLISSMTIERFAQLCSGSGIDGCLALDVKLHPNEFLLHTNATEQMLMCTNFIFHYERLFE